MLMDLNVFASAFTGGQVDAFRMAGLEPKILTKFRGTQTAYGYVFGPGFSTLTDVVQIGNGLGEYMESGEASMGTLGAIRRLIPGNNMHLLARPISNLQDRAYNALND